MTSITEHRYIFRRITQGRNQNFMDWYAALQKQAKYCQFSNEEGQIFDQIVAETSIKELRYRAFESEMSLDELVEWARRLECRDKECTRCGAKSHRYYEVKICPAGIHRCNICSMIGHFEKFCFHKAKKRTVSESSLLNVSPEKMFKKVEPKASSSKASSEKYFHRGQNQSSTIQKPLPNRSIAKQSSEKSFSCKIGGVTAKIFISNEFTVNVMAKKFFDSHRMMCSITGNEKATINGKNFTRQLETQVNRDGNCLLVDFFFSEELDEEKCFMTPSTAKRLGVK